MPLTSNESPDEKTTHFGYRTVSSNEKASLVAQVFNSVAKRYDLMNDAMSFGLHRLWKHFTINEAAIRPGMHVLDVAAGTGDLSLAMAKKVGEQGRVIMTDINEAMLKAGRTKLINHGILNNIQYLIADAEHLPFKDNSFDRITIGFGLRNVTNKESALASFYHALNPGGKLLILEFSKPIIKLLDQLYDTYSFHIIPKIGQFLANDSDSYQYLVESIRLHPNQETLKNMMHTVGFEDIVYHNLTGGIVALHIGYKY